MARLDKCNMIECPQIFWYIGQSKKFSENVQAMLNTILSGDGKVVGGQ